MIPSMMYCQPLYSESKSVSKKNRRAKNDHYCKVHGIRGIHLVNSKGKSPKNEFSFELLRNRKDFENLKKYNLENPDDKLKICNLWDCQCHVCKPPKKVSHKNKDLISDKIVSCYEKKEKPKFDKDESCCICLDSMKGRHFKKLGCSHSVCLKCYNILFIKDLDEEKKKVEYDYYEKYCINYNYILLPKVKDYSIKCPLCRSHVFNNNFEEVLV